MWEGPVSAFSPDTLTPELDAQVHLPCIFFVLRNSRHFSHCETGLPFFLTSNNGRSECWHPDERCPLMQDSLSRRLSTYDLMNYGWSK